MFLGDLIKDQKSVFTTELVEEDDIETISLLSDEKINIDVSWICRCVDVVSRLVTPSSPHQNIT